MASNGNWTDDPCADRSPEDRELQNLFANLRERGEDLPALEAARRTCEERLAREHGAGRAARGWDALRKGWWEMWRPANWSLLRVGGAVALLLLVLACTVPLDYDREAGLDLRVSMNGRLQPVVELLRTGPWDLESYNVQDNGGGGVVEARLRGARPEDLAELRALAGVTGVETSPWSEESRGSLFTMMMDNVFHVRLDISGMNDDEVNQAVNDQLQQQGYPGRVTVTRQEGMPNLLVEVDGDSLAAPGQLTIELSDQRDSIATEGIWVQEGRPLNLELGGLEGLSEAQIRARVEEQLRARGLNPDSTEIFIQNDLDETGGARTHDVRIQVRPGEGRP